MNSNYDWKKFNEIITSAIKGYERKEMKRKEKGQKKFRKAAQTLRTRIQNQLMEKTTWFKPKKDKEKEKGTLKTFKENKCTKGNKWKENKSEKEKVTPLAVMYVPFTHGSKLAKEIRKVVEELRPYTQISLKIVKRSGHKIVDSLHRSNPWENSMCERTGCFNCSISQKDQKSKFKSCKRRSIIYQTWCETCRLRLCKELGVENDVNERNEMNTGVKRKHEKEADTDKEKLERLEKEVSKKTYKYIGETSRSAFERGSEHLRDFKDFNPGSHLVRHVIKHHMNESEDVEFKMKILSSHFTAFNRQISKAVLIKRHEGKYLMN